MMMKMNRKLGGGEAGFPLKLSSLISARRAVSQSGQAPNRAPIPPQPPHPTSPTREISIAGLLRSLSATFIPWERSSLWWTALLDYWNWMRTLKCGKMAPKVQNIVWFPNQMGNLSIQSTTPPLHPFVIESHYLPDPPVGLEKWGSLWTKEQGDRSLQSFGPGVSGNDFWDFGNG